MKLRIRTYILTHFLNTNFILLITLLIFMLLFPYFNLNFNFLFDQSFLILLN